MKKKFLYLVIVNLIWCTLPAQDEALTNDFLKANELYNQAKYQEAIPLYEGVIASGKASKSLYYNLANAYYKSNKVGPSIYNFEKALLLDPSDADVLNNLKFAKNATIDQIDVVPESIITKTLRGIVMTFSEGTWAWISIASVLLFVGLFILYYRSKDVGQKRVLFLGSWLFAALALGAVLGAFKQRSLKENTTRAIVYAVSTIVKSEPNIQGDEIFTLHEGTKVTVLEALDSWKKIKLSDGKVGWVLGSAIKVL